MSKARSALKHTKLKCIRIQLCRVHLEFSVSCALEHAMIIKWNVSIRVPPRPLVLLELPQALPVLRQLRVVAAPLSLPGLSLPGSARNPALAAAASAQLSITDEIDQYLALEELDVATLDWWKQNSVRSPDVAILARKYLAIPCSSAPAERVFSHQAKMVYSRSRLRMAAETLSYLAFLHCNKKFDKPFS